MRLKSISLSGFKSFVDPTTIALSHNICVFVGPNGCGKSNVVDAVRLVIGESQATHIRGDSLSDVIFEGTDLRSPTVQASIELIFDNSDQKISGPYASYSDVALRREIYKDTRSKFFLNGRTCRRRDVQDLFLGSGFGARGYAIVEQGFVERLVEARPEELRQHIEEVAGISKYRERRRETEKRIRDTNENLERVRDHSAELSRHISRLSRQAREAQRFTELKDRERLARARLIVCRIRALDMTIAEHDQVVNRVQLEFQRGQTALQTTRTKIDGLREEEADVNESFNTVQGEAFEARSRSSRIEEEVSSRRLRITDLEREVRQLNSRRDNLARELAEDMSATEELVEAQDRIESERKGAQERTESANARVNDVQANFNSVQGRWNELLQEISEVERNRQVAQASLTSNAASLEELEVRQERAKHDVDLPIERDAIEALEQELASVDLTRKSIQESLERRESELELLDSQGQADENSRLELDKQLLSTRDQLATKAAFLESALGRQHTEEHRDWLTQFDLVDNPRVGEVIEVAPEWRKALEMVLGERIKAIPVPDLTNIFKQMSEDVFGDFMIVETALINSSSSSQSLLNQVSEGRDFVAPMVAGVFACESLHEALQMRTTLALGESAITKSGIWVGRHWIRVSGDVSDQQGVMQIRESIELLQAKLSRLESENELIQDKIRKRQERSTQLRNESRITQRELHEHASKFGSIQLELQRKQLQMAENRERRERALAELERIDKREDELQGESSKHKQTIKRLTSDLQTFAEERELVESERNQLSNELERVVVQSRNFGEEFRELDVKFNTTISRRESLQQSSIRRENDLLDLDRQLARLRSNRNELTEEIEKFAKERDSALSSYADVENRLNEIKSIRDRLVFDIRESSNMAVLQERNVQEIQQKLEGYREKQIQLNADRSHLLNDVVSTQHSYEEVAENLSDGDTEEALTRSLRRISNRIERLGAVNLAAAEDLAVLSDEHELVLKQVEDLEVSQSTLQQAIEKIDRETLSMFEETLKLANERLQKVFKNLFDGGTANLVLTDEDPLSAGISIQAQPPGKRNKSVHQLSGGEKTLTAIAFIFAMFELNPSPVCVLDEVDASLDDSNVERFVSLIGEMSKDVQFLIISHNRVTMQAAESLIGVTMQEAGVSRLVSVDLETAFESAMN